MSSGQDRIAGVALVIRWNWLLEIQAITLGAFFELPYKLLNAVRTIALAESHCLPEG
jgi:hypothetical protein